MRNLLSLTAIMLAGASLPAQQPADELAPQPGTTHPGQPEGLIDCTTIAPPFDVTSNSGTNDVRILGVANVDDLATGVHKWFFSGSNGGVNPQTNQQIYVFDSDAANYPIAASARGVLHHPNMVSPFWGHRDGEGYSYVDTTTSTFKSIVLFGDEAGNLMWMDAATETWVNSVATAGTVGTSRAIAVRRDDSIPGVNTETVKVYISDFSSGFEVWDLNLATGAISQDLTNPPLASPTATYGATVLFRNNQWYLAVHHQAAITCPGTGRVKLTVLDINPGVNYGMIVWTRSLDTSIPGASPNINGGIAGGLQLANVNGQPCFAGLQQTSQDSCGFVGLSVVQGLPGPADCGPETLIMQTDGTVLGLQLLNRNMANVYVVGLGFPPPAGLPLPFNPACTLDLSVPIPATFVLVGAAGFPSIPVPMGTVIDLVADAGALTSPITSTNRVDIRVRPAPF